MANKKKGHLTTSPEWAKHLRKYMKNQFWRGERFASKEFIRNELFETDNLLWQFEELILTLIAMTLPLEEQTNVNDIGAAVDEICGGFQLYYTLNKSRFAERELINEESKRLLDEIEAITDNWSSVKDQDFWLELEKHQTDWDVLREKAGSALKLLI